MKGHRSVSVYFTESEIVYVKALKQRLALNGQELINKLMEISAKFDDRLELMNGPVENLALPDRRRVSFLLSPSTRIRLEQLRVIYLSKYGPISMTQLIRTLIFGGGGKYLFDNYMEKEMEDVSVAVNY